MTTDSDADLLAAARAGNRQALEALLVRHQAQIYRFGMQMCRDPEDAKDVLQDTLLQMARGVHQFRGESSFATWLYSIARSFCIKKRRTSKFAPPREVSLEGDASKEAGELADPSLEPDALAAGKQLQAALSVAIHEIDPSYREVLILRDVEGLTAPEVAKVLGLSPDAVKSRLHRARQQVRDRMAPLLGIPQPGPAPATPCPDVLTLFSQHLENEISSDVCAEMERHLQSCKSCQSRCDSLRETLALCRTAPKVQVPRAVADAVRSALQEFLAGQKG